MQTGLSYLRKKGGKTVKVIIMLNVAAQFDSERKREEKDRKKDKETVIN